MQKSDPDQLSLLPQPDTSWILARPYFPPPPGREERKRRLDDLIAQWKRQREDTATNMT